MSERDFDRFLRQQLGRYPSELDTGALWETLAPQLAAEQKRRRAAFWWRAGTALLVLVVALGYLWHLQYAALDPLAPADLAAVSAAPEMPAAPASDHSNKRQSQVVPAPVVRQEALPLIAAGLDRPRAEIAGPIPARDEAGGERLPRHHPQFSSTALPAAGALQRGDLAAESPPENGLELPPLPLLPSQPLPSALLPTVWEEASAQRPAAPPSALGRRAPPLQLAGRTQLGAGLLRRTLADPSGEYADLLQLRQEAEQPLEYWQFGLLGGMRHASGWYALSGLSYTRLAERFSYRSTLTERDTLPDGIVEIVIDAAGDSAVLRGEVPFVRQISYQRRSYSSIRFWDVPAIVGFERRFGRWSAAAEGGVFLNLALRAQGDILMEGGARSRLETDQPFQASIRLSGYGSLRLGYAFRPGLEICLSPSWRRLPRNIAAADYPLRQTYALYGLNAGLNWRF